MTNKVKSKWDSLDKEVQRWATRLGAIATIIGVLVAGGSWIINQVNSNLASKLEAQTASLQQEVQALAQKVDDNDRSTELSLTRIELLSLINSRPDNVVEIEKVARHYFADLGGDWWMSDVYSDWARKHGGDIEFVLK